MVEGSATDEEENESLHGRIVVCQLAGMVKGWSRDWEEDLKKYKIYILQVGRMDGWGINREEGIGSQGKIVFRLLEDVTPPGKL